MVFSGVMRPRISKRVTRSQVNQTNCCRPRSHTGANATDAVIDHNALGNIDTDFFGCQQINIRCGFGMSNVMGRTDPPAKTIQQSDLAKRHIHLVMRTVAANCHRDGVAVQKVKNRTKIGVWLQVFFK